MAAHCYDAARVWLRYLWIEQNENAGGLCAWDSVLCVLEKMHKTNQQDHNGGN